MGNVVRLFIILLSLLYLNTSVAFTKTEKAICEAYATAKERQGCFLEFKQEGEIKKKNKRLKKIKSNAFKDMQVIAYMCQKVVAEKAKYQARNKGVLYFNWGNWNISSDGTITVIGDNIELQNGFGVWSSYIYSCSGNTITNKFTLNYIKQGKLRKR